MAIHKIRAETDRINLGESIPLETPMRVNIGVSTLCNFHCKFCYNKISAVGGGGGV
jgi:MoaA/NifB/PqqE/SkfB family radical SAM enzyme